MKVCPDPGLVRVVRRVQADAQSDANGGQAQGVWRFPPRVPQPAGWGGGQERPVMPCTGSVCKRHNTTDLGSDFTMHAHEEYRGIRAKNLHAHTASTNSSRVKTRCSLRRLRFASPHGRRGRARAPHDILALHTSRVAAHYAKWNWTAWPNAATQHACYAHHSMASSPPIACWSSSTCRGGSHPCGSAALHSAPMHRPARRRRPARRCSPR